MRKFFLGVAVGVVVSATTPLIAAQITGGAGYLIGWRVFTKGNTLCHDPFIWTATKEIECG